MKALLNRISVAAQLFLMFNAAILSAQSPHLRVDADTSITPVSPILYGLMTEEINYSYDGGLYAEIVRNRSFQHRGSNFNSWLPASKGNGMAELSGGDDGPSAALHTSMKLTVKLHR